MADHVATSHVGIVGLGGTGIVGSENLYIARDSGLTRGVDRAMNQIYRERLQQEDPLTHCGPSGLLET